MTAQIVVLGMHRSGTSLVAKLLQAMGYYLGETDDFLPENDGNPRGYWERKDIVALNKLLMSAQGSDWWNPQSFNVEDTADDVGQQFVKSARSTVGLLSKGGNFAIKDPRFVVTLPAWLPLLESPYFVICTRHPLAVAASLHDRNGIPVEVGLALWHWYNTRLLQVTAGYDGVILDYQTLLHTPEAHLKRLASTLPGATLTREALQLSLENIIDSSRAKQEVSAQAENTVPGNQLDLYEHMLAGDRDYQSNLLTSSVGMLELYRQSRNLSDELRRIKRENDGQIDSLQLSLEDQKGKVKRQTQKANDLRDENEQLRRDAERQIEALETSIENQKGKLMKSSLKSEELSCEVLRIREVTERQIENVRKSLDDQKAKAESNSLKSKNLRTAMERMEENFEHQKEALQKSLEDQQRKVMKHSQKSGDLESEITRLRKEYVREKEALQQSVDNQKNKVKKLSLSLDSYKRSLKSSNDALVVTRKKIALLRERIDAMESKNPKLKR